MPRTRSLAWSELKIGILAIVAILIATAVILTLGGQGGFPWDRYSLKVRFPNAAGVKAGSAVRVAGVEVGSVEALRFAGAEVELDLSLSRDMQDRVRTTSVASIGSVSLLGEGAVDITAETTGTPIPDGGMVPYAPGAGSLSDITERASGGLEELTGLLQDLRAGEGTAGRLLTDEALYDQLRQMANAGARVMQGIRDGEGSLGRLMRDPTTARELEETLTNLSTVTERLSEGEGGIGKLLADDSFATALTETTSNFEALSARLREGEGTAGRLLTDDTLYERLTGLVSEFEAVAVQIREGDGTAGSLLRDPQLYDNLNATVDELRGLIQDIRADPRRYLNVRVSIF